MIDTQPGRGFVKGKRKFLTIMTVSVVAAGVLSASLNASAEEPPDRGSDILTVNSSDRVDDQNRVEEYWTRERMENATQLDQQPPKRSKGKRNKSSVRRAEQIFEGTAGDVDGLTVDVPPQSTVGKVFVTIEGKDKEASGSVVVSDSHDLVVTAAHVLYSLEENRFVDNMMFAPGYNNGETPFGKWTAETVSVLKQWSENMPNRDDYDIGLVRLKPREDEKIQDVTGANGICFDCRKNASATIHGYPGAIDNGQRLISCQGRTEAKNNFLRMQNCPAITPGASGGPWLIDSDSGPMLISVTDRAVSDGSTEGVFLDETIQGFYSQYNRGELK